MIWMFLIFDGVSRKAIQVVSCGVLHTKETEQKQTLFEEKEFLAELMKSTFILHRIHILYFVCYI